MTIIIGINDSHDAAACIVKDGALVCAVSEERIQRVKSIGGFPANAIDACLDIAGLGRGDVDHVAFGSNKMSPFNLHNAFATLTVEDHIRIEEEYWQPVIYDGADVKLRDVLPDYKPAGILSYPLDDIPFAHMRELDDSISDRIHAMRREFAASFFGIEPANVHFIDHHTAHAYYAFVANPLRGREKDFLIVTGDAGATMRGLPPFPGAYLGNKADAASIAALAEHPLIRADYDMIADGTPDDVAHYLAAGEICAVFCDAMEFGPRALGHRSLLADASRPDSKERINNAIKKRDFWMPFAPAVLAERFDDYAINPKKGTATYMTMTFETTELARKHLAAALHPVDLSGRVQSVEKERSPILHAILKAFEARTGIGGVLNTSLNIHGKPIVMEPVQIATEILSADGIELNVLFIEGTLFVKKGTQP